MIKYLIKSSYVHLSRNPILDGVIRPFAKDIATVFYMHRIDDCTRGVSGYSPEFLDSVLIELKKRYNLISVIDIVRALRGEISPPLNAVAFMIDDGFIEQATVAAPIFIKHKCPLTISLITGFIDGDLWPWDSKVRHIFLSSKHDRVEINIMGESFLFSLITKKKRYQAMRVMRDKLKYFNNYQRDEILVELSRKLAVSITAEPPRAYEPMSWDQARDLESKGVTFACHSVSHSVFSCINDLQVKDEVARAWVRMRTELRNPLPLFVYPTGREQDFGVRDVSVICKQGFIGACSSIPGYINLSDSQKYQNFTLKRLPLDFEIKSVMFTCAGFGRITVSALQQIKAIGGKRYYGASMYHNVKNKLGFYNKYRLKEINKYDRLVFVCKGNICRSPFAEALARSYGIQAISCGYHTRGDAIADIRATENAKMFGVDLTSHKSTRAQDIIWSMNDCFIVMEPAHIKHVKNIFGSNVHIALLGLPYNSYIGDPYGKNDEYFQRCFSCMTTSIETIINLKKERECDARFS